MRGFGRPDRSHGVILVGMTHRVGPKGQVVTPRALRDALGLRPGDGVVFDRDGDAVRAEAATEERTLAAARLKVEHGCPDADAFAAATAMAHDGVLLTGDPGLLVADAPWRWEDLRT